MIYLQINSALGRYRLDKLLDNDNRSIHCVLMYHGIDSNDWAPLDVPEQAFFNEINFYQQQGYNIVAAASCDDVPRPTLELTFDDGNKNIKASLLKLVRQKIPFTIAICPGVVDTNSIYWFEELLARIQVLNQNDQTASIHELEKCKLQYFSGEIGRDKLLDHYRSKTKQLSEQELKNSKAVHENLNWSELRQLVDSGYCNIACHTLFHDAITALTTEQLKDDLNQCNSMIEQELGIMCDQFICPFGDYTEQYQGVLQECGYKRIYLSNDKVNFTDATKLNVIDRLKGVGLGNFSARYFEHLWLQNHSNRLRP